MKKHLSFILFTAFIFCGPVSAQEADYSKVRMISSVQGTGDLSQIDIGLEIAMKDNWYTYWRMPGDTGVAPVFDWSASTNVKDIVISWPAPKRFTTMDMNSFGYDGTVLFPMRLTPEEPGKDVRVKLKIDLMVCHDICIPQTITVDRLFSSGPATLTEDSAKIRSAFDSLPAKEDNGDITIGTAILGKDAVAITVKSKTPLSGDIDMIVETQQGFLTQRPDVIAPEIDGGDYVLKVAGPEGMDLTQELFGKAVTVTVVNDGKAIEKTISF